MKAFSSPRSEMLPASRWMPSSRAQPRAALRLGPSSGSAPGEQLLAPGQQVPLLRQGDELGAVGGGGADQALGRGEVPGLVGGRVELYRGCPQRFPFDLGPMLAD